jgi:hypothetical protein
VLARENERSWETYYLLRPAYVSWESWQAWLVEYRKIGRDMPGIAEEHDAADARREGYDTQALVVGRLSHDRGSRGSMFGGRP